MTGSGPGPGDGPVAGADVDPPGSGADGHLDRYLDAVLVGGRQPVPIEIVAYDPAWPRRFEAERARLAAALGPVARRIEHVGSTAVPGLAAKPVVDILVAVDDPDDDRSHHPALQGIGLELRVREPAHRMYRTPTRDVHVHLWAVGSDHVVRHLVFRDWLRDHADDRQRYEEVKRALAGRTWRDMNYYAEAKTGVIAEIMGRATAASA